MTASTQPLSEITQEAITVLVREMGVARTLRFLGQYQNGRGNYTDDRASFLADTSLDDLLEQARALDARQGS